jgi:hypothetical protein
VAERTAAMPLAGKAIRRRSFARATSVYISGRAAPVVYSFSAERFGESNGGSQ